MEITLGGVVLGSRDPRALARFYARLIGWTLEDDDPDWAKLRSPDGGRPVLSFQLEPDHVAPVWPPRPGAQQMQAHLDLGVDDLDAACAHAEQCGARRAEHQPNADGHSGETVIVYLDPDGHPFCLFTKQTGG